MKMCKKFMVLVLMFMMGLNSVIVKAEGINRLVEQGGTTIQPLYEDTRRVSVNLTLSGSTATGVTRVDTLRKCDISITMKLQKKSGEYWLTIKTWEASKSNATSLELTKNYTVPSGTYRVQSKIVSGADTITKTSSTKTVN